MLSWSPPSTGHECIDHYVINITSNGDSDKIMNSIETDTIISQLNHTLYHSFSVKAVDKAGRNGVFSNTVIFHFWSGM